MPYDLHPPPFFFLFGAVHMVQTGNHWDHQISAAPLRPSLSSPSMGSCNEYTGLWALSAHLWHPSACISLFSQCLGLVRILPVMGSSSPLQAAPPLLSCSASQAPASVTLRLVELESSPWFSPAVTHTLSLRRKGKGRKRRHFGF